MRIMACIHMAISTTTQTTFKGLLMMHRLGLLHRSEEDVLGRAQCGNRVCMVIAFFVGF